MRIVLAEDSVLLREGLVHLLADAGHDVVAAVGDGEALLEAVASQNPDLAVVDVRMPPAQTDEGLRAALTIRERWPGVGVLVLSQYVEKTHAATLLGGATEGLGYLLKDRVSEVAEFLGVLERVGAGGAAFDPEVVRQLLARTSHLDALARLSPRERQVLEHLAQGYANQAVADRIHVSLSTVEKHIASLSDKLDLPSDAGYNRRVLAILRYLDA
ncbi:response regulator transcription factor [Actinoplanes sp. NPDC089786]|uniref:response regulator transcription factor n=1 Tax=Actinoplanes sp. NPDC089786 TaxID=3155185 RepID=UPI00342F2322